MRHLLTLLLLMAVLPYAQPATAQTTTFTVDSLFPDGDDAPGDGTCDSGSGECTFRAALEEANATGGSGLVQIVFDVLVTPISPVSGVYRVRPTAPYELTRPNVTVDASTQPGASCGSLKWSGLSVDDHDLRIEIDGSALPSGSNGLFLRTNAANATVRGFAIYDAPSVGVFSGAFNTTLECSYLGLKADGTTAGTSTMTYGALLGFGGQISRVVSASNTNGLLINNGTIDESLIGLDVAYAVRGNAVGVLLTAPSATTKVTDSWVSGNTGAGIRATGGTIELDSVRVGYRQLSAIGFGPAPNQTGVQLIDVTNPVIERSYIVENLGDGVSVGGATTGLSIVESRIGAAEPLPDIDPTILANLQGNGGCGVSVTGSAAGQIGPNSGRERANVIVGHTNPLKAGVCIASTVADFRVTNNVIGTYAAPGEEEAALANLYGVIDDGTRTLVQGNRIAGNTANGIWSTFSSLDAEYNANLIGVDAGVSRAIPNGLAGILLDGEGAIVSENLVSGSGTYGIEITGLGSFVTLNTIGGSDGGGVTSAALSPFGNTEGGVLVANNRAFDASEATNIDGNTISSNGGPGVFVLNTAQAAISDNVFEANAGLAIDLNGTFGTTPDGVTANDTGDSDTGGNALLNFPRLSAPNVSSGLATQVFYDLDVPAGDYLVELYKTSGPDPSGHGEGTLVVSQTVNVLASPYFGTFNVNSSELTSDVWLTATATRFEAGAGNLETSEFAENVQPIVGNTFFSLDLLVWLHGAFDGADHALGLAASGSIPAADPYGFGVAVDQYGSAAAGGSSDYFEDNDITDWVQVDLYAGSTPETATLISSKPALVNQAGQVRDEEGNVLLFDNLPAGPYYVGIQHRNHLPVFSATALTVSFSSASYDFTQAGAAFGTNAQIEVASGEFAMIAGAVGSAEEVTAVSITQNGYLAQAGQPGYRVADFNLDGAVDVSDVLKWVEANGRSVLAP
ncbi:MAG: right-handed parallel beta-helix repeat-containing protein [Bacteroidota bacterium]